MKIENYTQKVLNNQLINKDEALNLLNYPFEDLIEQADIIRQHFCQNKFDICTIINVKSGNCSEDCKFCSQSVHYNTDITRYSLFGRDKLKEETLKLYNESLKRISYVASGLKLTDDEFKEVYTTITELKRDYPDINLCVSLGILSKEQIKLLQEAGVSRIHNNLETSKDYFKNICSTHKFQDKLKTLENIDNQKIKICSGAIFGVGESFEDRIDLALTLQSLNIHSIPINILNPIKNTPLENMGVLSNEEVCKIIAIYRFINPTAFIRMAGGRLQLPDHGRLAFKSGANAAIVGNMLTTNGVSYEEDLKMIKELGYEITYMF